MDKKVRVHHYTTAEGVRGIATDGRIKQSTDTTRDARFGEGTYVTKMDPSKHSKSQIVANNYDGSTKLQRQQIRNGKADYCVSADVPASRLKKEHDPHNPSRDVHRYDGDIPLGKGSNPSVTKVTKRNK